MRTKLACVAMALLAGACGGRSESPAAVDIGGLGLVSVQPASGPASLARARPVDCPWCTTAFSAEISVSSPSTLTGVNLWLDGWSGSRRCLYSQHDSPADGFTLVGGQPATVGFHQAAIECAAPFTIDRIDVRARSADTGDAIVYRGSWNVSLTFVE